MSDGAAARSDDEDVHSLLRLAVRGFVRRETIVTKEEATELLPLLGGRWFADVMKDRHIGFAGGEALYRWGDVLSALEGEPSDALNGSRYLTPSEAAAYLRYPSVNALKVAVSRKQIVPSGRRGRTLLFKRDDLDRQVRNAEALRSTAGAPATESEKDGDVKDREDGHEFVESDAATDDPYGLFAMLARVRGEQWPPKRRRRRR